MAEDPLAQRGRQIGESGVGRVGPQLALRHGGSPREKETPGSTYRRGRAVDEGGPDRPADEPALRPSASIEPEKCSGSDVGPFFRELKASSALDKFRMTTPDVVEALIRSALLTLTAARRLHTLIRQRAVPELRARYTQLRFAIHFRRGAQYVLACLLQHLGFERAERSSHRGMNLYLVV